MDASTDAVGRADIPAAQRRARLEMARMALPSFPDDHVELFHDWVRMLPATAAGSSLDPVRSLGAALSGDLGRVRWEADVSAKAVIEPLVGFCHDWGADAKGLDLLGSIGAQLDPPVLGTWVESRADGFDLGWAVEGRWGFDDLRAFLPLPVPAGAEGVVRRVARSLATGAPTSRMRVELPPTDQSGQVAAASDLLAKLGAPLPSDGALGVLLNLAQGALTLSLWTLDDGVAATGLTTSMPSTELLVAVARELGQAGSLDTLAQFGALLLVDGPVELELRVRSTGEEVELRYEVPATAPPA